jgi:hypothetical protein
MVLPVFERARAKAVAARVLRRAAKDRPHFDAIQLRDQRLEERKARLRGHRVEAARLPVLGPAGHRIGSK